MQQKAFIKDLYLKSQLMVKTECFPIRLEIAKIILSLPYLVKSLAIEIGYENEIKC